MQVPDILGVLLSSSLRLVEITGGEPLLQSDTPELAKALLYAGFKVLVETNGSLDISQLPEGVIRIMDLKCPSSGEGHRNRWQNISLLTPHDEIKFVIANRIDYEWAHQTLQGRLRGLQNTVLFSPVHGELAPATLAEWILTDSLNVRLQVQLHKYLWPLETRGV